MFHHTKLKNNNNENNNGRKIMKTIEYDPAKIKLMPSLPRHEPSIMDSTAAKWLMKCRRYYFYRAVLGRVPPTNKFQLILDWGSAYHKFRELLETESYLKAMSYALQVNLPTVDPKNKFAFLDKQRFIKTCQVAADHAQKEKEQGKIKVVAVEQPFNCEIAPGLFIGGRADQIIEWNSRLWGRDFKTTTKDKATFQRQLNPNDQAIRYIVGESAVHGQKIQGIVFEAVYNAKTVGPSIYSINTTRNQYEIDMWLKDQALLSRQLQVYREEDHWPMDMFGNCDWCEYHPVCSASSMGTQEGILRQNFKLSPWDHTNVDQEER